MLNVENIFKGIQWKQHTQTIAYWPWPCKYPETTFTKLFVVEWQ